MCTFIYKKVGNNYSILTMYAQIQIDRAVVAMVTFYAGYAISLRADTL